MRSETEAEVRARVAASRQASVEAVWLATQIKTAEEEWSRRSSDRHERIRERAYYKALQRGFVPGSELMDWLEAEREVDQDFSGRASRNGASKLE